MKFIPINSISLTGFCILLIAINTVFMQFLLYDSQYRLLNPQHYNVDVITQEDYKQLSNPENRSVKLSSGNTLTKAEVWDSHVLPKYKSVNNGSQYVLVTLRGTAPFVRRWYESAVMPIVAVLLAIPLLNIIIRKRLKEPQKTEK